MVADPNYDASTAPQESPTTEPTPEPTDVITEVENGDKSLADVIQEKQDTEEQQKREKELDEKVNAELGIETKEEEQTTVEDVKTEAEIKKEVIEDIKEDPIVEIEVEKKELSDEAVKALQKIKDTYDKEVVKLRVDNQILTQEKEAYKAKADELIKERADLEAKGANASTRAIYFDKVMESGDKGKITDYLVDLLGVHYPSISKDKLTEFVTSNGSNRRFDTSVRADVPLE